MTSTPHRLPDATWGTSARTVVLIGLVPLLLAGLAYGGTWLWAAREQPHIWDEVGMTGTHTLEVRWLGSTCQRSQDVEVEESAEEVRILVLESVAPGGCSDVGVPQVSTVILDGPLDGRRVVDAACTRAGLTRCERSG